MITTKIYQDQNGELEAVVFEDGHYANYVPCPEVVALDGEGLFEEARWGFSDAWLYEKDSMVGLTMERAAARAEQNSTLVAEIGQEIVVYPRRLSPDHQELFQIYAGDEAWNKLLEQVSGSEGGRLEL